MSYQTLINKGITGTSGSLRRDFTLIKKNLNDELNKIKSKTAKGLILAAIEIRRDMEVTPPIIPIDYGNLRASFFIVTNPNAKANVKSMEIKSATFSNTNKKNELSILTAEHKQTVSDAEGETSKFPIAVMMGFSAYYSAPVHEATDPNINWSRPNSGPKFFQAAVFRNYKKIVTIVKNNAQIP